MSTLWKAFISMPKIERAMLVTGVGCVLFAGIACGVLIERALKYHYPLETAVKAPIKPPPVVIKEVVTKHPVYFAGVHRSETRCIKGYLFVLSSTGHVEQVFMRTISHSGGMPMACKEGDE